MSTELKNTATPTLTFDPFEEAEVKPIIDINQPEAEAEAENMLSEEERLMVNSFAEKIDLNDSKLILQYGAGTQKKMSDFSQMALDNIRSKELGEVGKLLSDVVVELKSFDAGEEKNGVLGFFKKGKKEN